ncbi:MAG: cytochrome C oxidase subunit IV family protein [Actinobacteria bacterium]|nr:cytochrome C oxidase subunit IV family protein [Actinomycetota bacterium]MCB9388472.1 cytochrome C oxidase subunit IV family protein [Acidimicrobiia bacterium]
MATAVAAGSQQKALGSGEADSHSGGGGAKYVAIAVFLAILTGLEIWVSYAGLSHGLEVALLIGMMIIKFVIVAAFFMHLQGDRPMLSWLFGFAILGALVLTIATVASVSTYTPETLDGTPQPVSTGESAGE